MAKVVSIKRIIAAVERDNNEGICISCGDSVHGVEPDARNYNCENCGENKVFGAEELLIMYGA